MSNVTNQDKLRVHALDTQYSKLYSSVPAGALQSNSFLGIAGTNVLPPNMLYNYAAGFFLHVTDGSGTLTAASSAGATTFEIQPAVAAGENAAVVLMNKLGLDNIGDTVVMRFWIRGDTGAAGTISLDFNGRVAGTEFIDTSGAAIANGVLQLVGNSSTGIATRHVSVTKDSATKVMILAY